MNLLFNVLCYEAHTIIHNVEYVSLVHYNHNFPNTCIKTIGA